MPAMPEPAHDLYTVIPINPIAPKQTTKSRYPAPAHAAR
jgi:hypothetical protein